MKMIIALFVTIQMFQAHQAHAAERSINEIDACKKITMMGVLAKDNMPYWANSTENGADVDACYEAVVNVIQTQGVPDDLRGKISNTVQILNSDEDFAAFIETHEATPSNFNVDVPQDGSILPITRPDTPAFFTN
jgi:hypothetical protein